MSKKHKKTPYEHIKWVEREHLAYLYNKDKRSSIRVIAEEMNRSRNTIVLEINSGLVDDMYVPELAQKKAKLLRKRSKSQLLKVLEDGKLRKEIENDIRKRISPKRISGGLKNKGINISAKAIYKFVYGYNLESYLCFEGKGKDRKGQYVYRKTKELDKVRIKDRPSVRGIYGNYEMDFIVSSYSKYVLLVVVEMHTKKVYVKKIENRTHEVVLKALVEIFENKFVLSITTDNDIAFSNWKEFEKVLNTKLYFCEPYHSWEKGLVENTNRWIRLFVKKKSDIALVSDSKISNILSWFNCYPREIIGFKTSNELESELLAEICTT